jgi:hypothetical protein
MEGSVVALAHDGCCPKSNVAPGLRGCGKMRSASLEAGTVKESSEARKHVLAKAPSRKGREAQVSCFLCALCGLAPLREIVLICSHLLSAELCLFRHSSILS